jgi:hypothetical protein
MDSTPTQSISFILVNYDIELSSILTIVGQNDLRQLLKAKERHKQNAMHIEDTQRLITEIEMLKIMLF